MTPSIAHREDGSPVVDVIAEVVPPFPPEAASKEFCDILKKYRCSEVKGDRYAASWCSSVTSKPRRRCIQTSRAARRQPTQRFDRQAQATPIRYASRGRKARPAVFATQSCNERGDYALRQFAAARPALPTVRKMQVLGHRPAPRAQLVAMHQLQQPMGTARNDGAFQPPGRLVRSDLRKEVKRVWKEASPAGHKPLIS